VGRLGTVGRVEATAIPRVDNATQRAEKPGLNIVLGTMGREGPRLAALCGAGQNLSVSTGTVPQRLACRPL